MRHTILWEQADNSIGMCILICLFLKKHAQQKINKIYALFMNNLHLF